MSDPTEDLDALFEEVAAQHRSETSVTAAPSQAAHRWFRYTLFSDRRCRTDRQHYRNDHGHGPAEPDTAIGKLGGASMGALYQKPALAGFFHSLANFRRQLFTQKCRYFVRPHSVRNEP